MPFTLWTSDGDDGSGSASVSIDPDAGDFIIAIVGGDASAGVFTFDDPDMTANQTNLGLDSFAASTWKICDTTGPYTLTVTNGGSPLTGLFVAALTPDFPLSNVTLTSPQVRGFQPYPDLPDAPYFASVFISYGAANPTPNDVDTSYLYRLLFGDSTFGVIFNDGNPSDLGVADPAGPPYYEIHQYTMAGATPPAPDTFSSVATIDHDLVVGAGPDDHHAEQHALVGPDHLEGFFTKSGVSPTITDADFATTPEDGMPAMTIDTSTGIKLMWVRANSAWDAVEVIA